jgi:hypothetical protein
MPSRVSEAILKKEMNGVGKARMLHSNFGDKAVAGENGHFPFLALETDGAPFPLLTEANLEAFIVQAKRMHERKNGNPAPSGIKIPESHP